MKVIITPPSARYRVFNYLKSWCKSLSVTAFREFHGLDLELLCPVSQGYNPEPKQNCVEGFDLIFTTPPTKKKNKTCAFVLKYNLHRRECTNLSCTAQWMLTYVRIYPGNQHPDHDIEHVYYSRKFLHDSFQSIALPCSRGNCFSDFYNYNLVLHIFSWT